MQLKLIKDTCCPNCGSETVAESCTHRHCNGQGFEVRTFKCGCELKWIPNFERLEIGRKCPKHPDEINFAEKRKVAKAKLLAFIKTLDVDDHFKKEPERGFSYIS